MELRATREMRRNEQLSKAMAKKADTLDAPAKAQAKPAQQQESADKLTLSRQALAFFEEQNRLRQAEEQRRAAQKQSGSSELDLLEKALDVQDKCLKIAASIMKGNRVPPEDLEYLMNNDPEGYKLAMAMRRENPDPEDEESVLDDEDRNGGRTEASGDSGEAPGVSKAEASSGGGETSSAAE
ncbi:MAG: hypothetical protein K2M15_11060 [Oscillospiraceae bacterium]|nr:hypothetical protein [Oscillospiraceae bacterium]MDE7171067.1 hypothetical protein [Oscillospiraceae bacterium]